MEIEINKYQYQNTIFKKRLSIISGANLTLTPLVDVIFLLLIFIMVGSSLVFESGHTVNLPETQENFRSFADKLIITLTKGKLLFFNDQPLKDLNHLEQRLANVAYTHDTKQRLNRTSDNDAYRRPIVILKADKDVTYDDIVKIMSITRRYGFSVFLVTKSEES